jgi:ferredoxin
VIFEKDLASLQKQLPNFKMLVIASRADEAWAGPRGRLSRDLIDSNLAGNVANQSFFLCGPLPYMEELETVLTSLGARKEQIYQERFTVGTLPASSKSAVSSGPSSLEFAKSGKTFDCSPTESILTIAEDHGIEIPFDCRVGQCGTCATRVLEGDVEMEVEDGLDPTLKASGYRLMCVGHARGHVKLDA